MAPAFFAEQAENCTKNSRQLRPSCAIANAYQMTSSTNGSRSWKRVKMRYSSFMIGLKKVNCGRDTRATTRHFAKFSSAKEAQALLTGIPNDAAAFLRRSGGAKSAQTTVPQQQIKLSTEVQNSTTKVQLALDEINCLKASTDACSKIGASPSATHWDVNDQMSKTRLRR
jgi:hypothetical protein